MKTYYYIDTENIGNDWVSLANQENAILNVFFTTNSKPLTFSQAQILSHTKVEYIDCLKGKNALDFQLSSYLGYMICQHLDDCHIIISNDLGYDAVVNFWKKENILIKRNSFNQNQQVKLLNDINEMKFTQLIESSLKTNNINIPNLEIFFKQIPFTSKQDLHNALVKHFPNQHQSIYKIIKPYFSTLKELKS